jgi:TPR repeat protein
VFKTKYTKTPLVSGVIAATVVSVDKPFLRRMFGRSPTQAAESIESKAEHGDAEAQFKLGQRCADGELEAQDFASAARWYLQAAQQQHPLAQFNLGLLYAHGQGVPRDDGQALAWILRAAQQGIADAQFNLGMRHYRVAIQAGQNDRSEARIEAYVWLNLAAAQGHKGSAEACQCMTLSMTRAEVAEGRQRQFAFTRSEKALPAQT